MPETVSSLVPLLVCGASALFLSIVCRRRRRTAARTALLALARLEPLPAPDEDLATHRMAVLLAVQQVVDAAYARVAGLYEEPHQSAPLI